MKKIIALLLALVLVLSLAACGNKAEESTPPADDGTSAEDNTQAPEDNTDTDAPAEGEGENEPLTIGLSMYTLEYPFYVTMNDAFIAACDAKGWDCITTNASTDVSTQLNDCLDLINKNIDALALTSWYGDSLAEVFDTCASKGIPVFLMDTATIPRSLRLWAMKPHGRSERIESLRCRPAKMVTTTPCWMKTTTRLMAVRLITLNCPCSKSAADSSATVTERCLISSIWIPHLSLFFDYFNTVAGELQSENTGSRIREKPA